MANTPIISPVAGIVSVIECAVGSSVGLEDPIVTVECMKMLIPVAATASGRVTEMCVNEGDMLEEGQIICILEA